jgi:UDP-3-O-[3-hydroxymyristoyl] glucosamine N-acyltransferase
MALLEELARLVGGRLQGGPQLSIHGAATLRWAQPGEISLVEAANYVRHIPASRASAFVIPESLAASLAELDRPAIVVGQCAEAFAAIVAHFRPLPVASSHGISSAAHIEPTAVLGPEVTVYPGAYIGEHVRIGARSIIHSGCSVLAGSHLGEDCRLFPNVVLYEGTRVGNRVLIHANAVIGAYGFGYSTARGRHQLSPQVGHVEVQDDVEIGAGTTIDRGTYDATVIGEGTKIDNLVMIAHNCHIGRHNLLCSQVGIAGSCTTGDYVIMAGQVGIRDHVDIGDQARLGAKAGVAHNIPAGETYLGIPARPEREERSMVAALIKLPEMRKQFKAVERLVAKLEKQLAAAEAAEHATKPDKDNASEDQSDAA